MKINKLRHSLAKAKDVMVDNARKMYAPIRKKRLDFTDFSIISNNCWGGIIYKRYGLPYATPTVGVYFFADDYLKFCKNLRYYISLPMTIINSEESKHYQVLEERHHLNCPLGKIDDVEVVFLHYHSPEEAIEKWERRKRRINWDKLIVKFSQMNLCSEYHLKEFLSLDFETKFAFVTADVQIKNDNLICVENIKKQVINDTNRYADYIDINKLINENVIYPRKTSFSK